MGDAYVMDAPVMDAPVVQTDAPPGDATTCSAVENSGGTCNNLTPIGTIVATLCSSAEPPQPQGGAIEDGVYVLTSATVYGGCLTGSSLSDTWSVCGDHWDVANVYTDADGGVVAPSQLNYIVSAQGTSIQLAQFCTSSPTDAAPPGVRTVGYTAAPGHLTFFEEVFSGDVLVFEHIRQ